MKEQTKKQKERSKVWSKRICIKANQKKYIKQLKTELGFKTEAGTLDYVINQFKKVNKKYM